MALLVLYRWVDPPASTLMLGQRLAGTPISQRWVPLERMSPNLAAAVISSEDGHFCRHHGVDWGELKEAIESAGDGIARGGSTISMQVVKNLFLWPSRSYLRKALEIPLAYAMEALWPKRRVLEIYLNIAEWGPGIFGAEAAARYHFRKPALLLTPREAALLAVSLPNPFERQAGRPGPGTVRLADNLLLRMRAAQAKRPACAPGRIQGKPGLTCGRSPNRPGAAADACDSLWPGAGNAAISPAADAAGCFGHCQGLRCCISQENSMAVPQKENLADEAREPPLGGRADRTRLRRGQGVGRAPAAAPHRPEIGQVPRAPDPGAKGRRLR